MKKTTIEGFTKDKCKGNIYCSCCKKGYIFGLRETKAGFMQFEC